MKSIGNLTKMIQDDIYLEPPRWLVDGSECRTIVLLEGEYVRDYSATAPEFALYPYEPGAALPNELSRDAHAFHHFWGYRPLLWSRRSRASKFAPLHTISGSKFYEYPFYFHDR